MSNLFKFQDEEECQCQSCVLTEEYIQPILESDSVEELKFIIRELIDKADNMGYKKALVDDIHRKMEVLDVLESAEECDCCEECCDGECGL